MTDKLPAKVTPETHGGRRYPASRPGALWTAFSIEIAIYLAIGVVGLLKLLIDSWLH